VRTFTTVTREDLGFRSANTDVHTHALHSYPAKFIPQLVNELITSFSKPGDRIADIFAGSGTTNLEAMCLGRFSLAVDVNPVASLITRAKTAIVDPNILTQTIEQVVANALLLAQDLTVESPTVLALLEGKNLERLLYWFPSDNVVVLAFLLEQIHGVADESLRDLLLLIFSSSLKPASNWLDWSVKPQRDCRPLLPEDLTTVVPKVRYRRQVPPVADVFKRKGKEVAKRYAASVAHLTQQAAYQPEVVCADIQYFALGKDVFDAVITSPPYLTSYEYADLHQLTAYWLCNTQTVMAFKKLGFIGTRVHEVKMVEPPLVASRSLDRLRKVVKPSAQKYLDQYFTSMHQAFAKAYEALKPGGHFCIVIGNSRFQGYEIANHEVFLEILEPLGFTVENVWERPIPNKRLTSLRHATTGRILPKIFQGTENAIEIYPTEHILVLKK
jgi:DNA modification methylase